MRQGDIWLINLDPTVGSEIKKTRPAIIVNDNAIGRLPLKIISLLPTGKTNTILPLGWSRSNRTSGTDLKRHQPQTVFRYALFLNRDLQIKWGLQTLTLSTRSKMDWQKCYLSATDHLKENYLP